MNLNENKYECPEDLEKGKLCNYIIISQNKAMEGTANHAPSEPKETKDKMRV